MADQLFQLKKLACDAIDSNSGSLHELSSDIWKHPELCFEEHYAHDRITSYLKSHKFSVERKYVVDTAFRSVVDCGAGPNVAILCEYDALPDIGHACGHNLIAEVGVGASIGVKAAMDAARDTGVKLGKVHYKIGVSIYYHWVVVLYKSFSQVPCGCIALRYL